MWHLATAHAQTLHSGWAYNRVKIPSCKNFEAKEGMGVYSRWAYFHEGTVYISTTVDIVTVHLCRSQLPQTTVRVEHFEVFLI